MWGGRGRGAYSVWVGGGGGEVGGAHTCRCVCACVCVCVCGVGWGAHTLSAGWGGGTSERHLLHVIPPLLPPPPLPLQPIVRFPTTEEWEQRHLLHFSNCTLPVVLYITWPHNLLEFFSRCVLGTQLGVVSDPVRCGLSTQIGAVVTPRSTCPSSPPPPVQRACPRVRLP